MEWCERCLEFEQRIDNLLNETNMTRESLCRLLAIQNKHTEAWREKAREYLSLLRQHGIEVKE